MNSLSLAFFPVPKDRYFHDLIFLAPRVPGSICALISLKPEGALRTPMRFLPTDSLYLHIFRPACQTFAVSLLITFLSSFPRCP